jgi:uncharacterized protein YprB with RNaseH-like and TPR domain
VFTVEARHAHGEPHGHGLLSFNASMEVLSEWARDSRLVGLPYQAFAFLDTETTGLSGGTGTYAFLIGVGRFEFNPQTSDYEFRLAQFFMRDPIEEPAQLAALEEFLAPCQVLVTFNGKTFDVPLLSTRFLVHGWRTPLAELGHVDLLQLARRLWPHRLSSRTLPNLEAHILGTLRSDEDLPGWMIPSLYFDYLHDGDARPMSKVFYHNSMDVLSLVALMAHMVDLLNDPINFGSEYSVDLIALARLFEDLSDLDRAAQLYLHGLEHEDVRNSSIPRSVLLQALQRLALIHKRKKDWPSAIQLWERAAQHQHLPAHLELTKCYEHNYRSYNEALSWTQEAINLIESLSCESDPDKDRLFLTDYERSRWLEDFNYRMARLNRKLSS